MKLFIKSKGIKVGPRAVLVLAILLTGSCLQAAMPGYGACTQNPTYTPNTYSMALGDLNGDGQLDLIAGNADFPKGGALNHVYMNNGTVDPFSESSGISIAGDVANTYSVVLGDLDGDGDIDMVTGNFGKNRLYLNNGTANPFEGGVGMDIGVEENFTMSLAIGDVNGDKLPDLVMGNFGSVNRLYLNNASRSPFNNVSGVDISSDEHATVSVALGDVDGDGDLDIVAGNYGKNRLYLNNGTASPFQGVAGMDISADDHFTTSLALGDINGDKRLDLIAGNGHLDGLGESNRLYLNNGTTDPFKAVRGVDIGIEVDITQSLALGDVNGDGIPDLICGNVGPDMLYLNTGAVPSYFNTRGIRIGVPSITVEDTKSIVVGDLDGDGHLELIAGNCLIRPNIR